jgi:hypothetical protein
MHFNYVIILLKGVTDVRFGGACLGSRYGVVTNCYKCCLLLSWLCNLPPTIRGVTVLYLMVNRRDYLVA